MDREVFRDTMLAFIRDANPGVAIDGVSDDDDLVDLGYIDSLRIMELILVLEETFGISILLEAIDPRVFRTMGRVYEMVISQQRNE
jgi:acyl carrier protein